MPRRTTGFRPWLVREVFTPQSLKPQAFFSRATEGIRTPDPLDHNQVL